jgi:hypothetical protein
VIRAATYVLAVVQYFVGQAAIVGYLHERRGVPVLRASGWILFISGINLGVLLLLAAFGLLVGGVDLPWIWTIPAGVGVASLGYALLLHKNPRSLADVRLLAPLFEAGIVGHVKAVVVRLPHVLVLIVWHFLALRWFGVKVPALTALVLLPAVFFAAALPISVQGLGVSQAVAIYFFARYAQSGEAAVFSYSTTMTAIATLVQVAMGILFLPVAKRLGMSAPAEADGGETGEPPAPRAQPQAGALKVSDG